MKRVTLKTKCLIALASGLLACGVAIAAPTAQIVAGQTTVDLDAGFLAALESLNVTPAPIVPGSLVGAQVSYAIPGGAVDLGTLAGDIFHVGGLSLSTDDTNVGLLNFIISTTGAPTLTGIVTLNGSVVDRLPLFVLDLGEASVNIEANTVTISNVGVTLTEAAAMTLSDVFGANVPVLPVGVATVVAQAAPGPDGGDDDDERADDEVSDDDNSDDEDEDRRPFRRWRNRQ